MKTEQEIREKFQQLVIQRDSCPKGSAAREMLSERIRGVAWTFGHEQVPELLLSGPAIDIYSCVS